MSQDKAGWTVVKKNSRSRSPVQEKGEWQRRASLPWSSESITNVNVDEEEEELDRLAQIAKIRARSKSISSYDQRFQVNQISDGLGKLAMTAASSDDVAGLASIWGSKDKRTLWNEKEVSHVSSSQQTQSPERFEYPRRIDPFYMYQNTRRHTVASPSVSYRVPGRLLQDAVQTIDSEYTEVGRGVPLHALPSTTQLYIVEFKAGRSDIFYVAENTGLEVHKGDLVIVEADRGKDLGKVINSITPHQIHMLQAQQSEALNDLHRINREIHPKRIYRLSQPQEVTMLVTKSQDESKAMAVCQTKVRQKKLNMEVVDAEYQWDRRKLTFYFVAERRIDFRELVHDLFKIYKTRIWMCAVNAISKVPLISSPKANVDHS